MCIAQRMLKTEITEITEMTEMTDIPEIGHPYEPPYFHCQQRLSEGVLDHVQATECQQEND